LTGAATLADLLRDPHIGSSRVGEELGELRTDVRVLLEQQLFEHHAVDADHLLQLGS
jgi:hypothetical protein